ncbi:peptide-methionine (S)-S-oxide reductase MsrA [Cypionkella sp. TWP1-2-1b2]|uniref:peptide-methionine (S)-S-oxide reductase MsrA n=1 Tax=Cypionkella sp. TWP1-2-1b2 TaxID=2804675 RepID=UPI003CF6E37A
MIRLTLALMLIASAASAKTQTAVVAGGCFWCVESNFESVPGVKDVISGYTGGNSQNPTYDDHEGHYEAVKITYDDAKISYAEIVAKFLHSTDVVDAGGQFCDRGKAYSSAIFVSDNAEKQIAKAEIAKAQTALGQNVVTPVLSAKTFWPAEAYHQDYYKSTDLVLTRRGPKEKRNAYKFYRDSCGRDERLEQLWGSAAEFTR